MYRLLLNTLNIKWLHVIVCVTFNERFIKVLCNLYNVCIQQFGDSTIIFDLSISDVFI